MKIKIITFFILFFINNLLHQINEKITIVIFSLILFIIIHLLSSMVNNVFSTKIHNLLNDIHMYMDSLLSFFYLTKNIFLSIKNLIGDYNLLFYFFKIKINNFILLHQNKYLVIKK